MTVWKIGAWPGIWKDNQESRDKFIKEYALPRGFVAVGSGKIDDLGAREPRTGTNGLITRFAEKDVVLLYTGSLCEGRHPYRRKNAYVYVGIVNKPYYKFPNKEDEIDIKGAKWPDVARHRVDVEWESDQNGPKRFEARFNRRCNICEVKKTDFGKIKSEELRKWLSERMDGKIRIPGSHYDVNEKAQDGYSEGNPSEMIQTRRERDPKARAAAIKECGTVCKVCGFDFFKKYGEFGEGYIEVHHKKPIKDLLPGEKTKLEDLTVVCSNCHRMLHQKDPPIDVDKLKSIVNKSITSS